MSKPRRFLVEQALRAEQLGHKLGVETRAGAGPGGRDLFWATCTCGYKSTRRNTQAMALGAAFHHIGVVERVHQANGVSLPGSVSPAL